MKKKTSAEPTPDARRKSIAKDVQAFLDAGHEINQIPDGMSGQDPYGRGKPLRLGNPKK